MHRSCRRGQPRPGRPRQRPAGRPSCRAVPSWDQLPRPTARCRLPRPHPGRLPGLCCHRLRPAGLLSWPQYRAGIRRPHPAGTCQPRPGRPDHPDGLDDRLDPLRRTGDYRKRCRTGDYRKRCRRVCRRPCRPFRHPPVCSFRAAPGIPHAKTSRAATLPGSGPRWKMSGGVLLSHAVPRAVPSALKGLTSGFGMGPGVSPSPWPPKHYGGVKPRCHRLAPDPARPTAPREPHSGRETSCSGTERSRSQATRPISTGQLHTLPCFHLRPINPVV